MSARAAVRRPSTVQSAFPVVVPSPRDSGVGGEKKGYDSESGERAGAIVHGVCVG